MDSGKRMMSTEEAEFQEPGSLAIAFDVDLASLASLQQGLRGWKIETIWGATATSLDRYWSPGTVDLLVVGHQENVTDTLGLCRFLLSSDSQARAPILVLVPAEQRHIVSAVLKAGAHSCLMLPIHAKDVASMLVRTRQRNQPGRHTLNLEQAQKEDLWRDIGGQG